MKRAEPPKRVTAEYLRRLIRQAGMTQAEAAELVGVTHRTMKRYLGDDPEKISAAAVIVLELAAKKGHENIKKGHGVPLPPAESVSLSPHTVS